MTALLPPGGLRRRAILGAALVVVAGCDGDGRVAPDSRPAGGLADIADDTEDATPRHETAAPDSDPTDAADPVTDTSAPPSTARIPGDTLPCEAAAFWPYSVAQAVPGWPTSVRVHYRSAAEERTALDVLGLALASLPIQLETLGFRLPPTDAGRCGPDDAIDVFLWRDSPLTYTDLVAEARETWWEDGPPYVVLDAFGELGGRFLPSTVTHELNHVLQAADSWYDAPIAYEMTAMYVEDILHDDDDNYLDLIEDYQASPDRSVDWDDGYATFFMYGSCIFLQYLEARFFRDDPRFIGRVWEGMRNRPDANEPDFLDALNGVLGEKGRSFDDAVLEFARWRWYTGRRDDGRHLPEAGAHPPEAEAPVWASLTIGDDGAYVDLRPMLFGTHYVALDVAEGEHVALSLEGDAAVHWVVQALPAPGAALGADDGAILLADLGDTTFVAEPGLTLAVTVLPGPLVDPDPDRRRDARYRGGLTLRRAR